MMISDTKVQDSISPIDGASQDDDSDF
jgi:hypothetical protein